MGKGVYRIFVINRNENFHCRTENSLLAGMERQSKSVIRVGCRGGGCGVCKIRIVSGEYCVKRVSVKHVTPEQAKLGIVLSCQVFPMSDLVIESDYDLNDLAEK
jgi:ferredoxin